MEQKDCVKCPKCGAPMVERKRKYDSHPFLGCQNYPACNGTISTHRRYNRKTMDEAAPPRKGLSRHHINGNSDDDRPENIYYCPDREHKQIHAEAKRRYKKLGWNMEATTRWWMTGKGKRGVIVVDEERVKEYDKKIFGK